MPSSTPRIRSASMEWKIASNEYTCDTTSFIEDVTISGGTPPTPRAARPANPSAPSYGRTIGMLQGLEAADLWSYLRENDCAGTEMLTYTFGSSFTKAPRTRYGPSPSPGGPNPPPSTPPARTGPPPPRSNCPSLTSQSSTTPPSVMGVQYEFTGLKDFETYLDRLSDTDAIINTANQLAAEPLGWNRIHLPESRRRTGGVRKGEEDGDGEITSPRGMRTP